MYRLSDFDYSLPKELIAQYPLRRRITARLLVLNRKEKRIEHRLFKDLPEYFQEGDLLVLNDTKVLPVRLVGRRPSGAKVEVLLLTKKEDLIFDVLIKPKRVRINERLIFDNGRLEGILTAKDQITFLAKDIQQIYKAGRMPLPPYIKRQPTKLDEIYYQTVYAKNPGSIAAPTAGLHFNHRLIRQINLKVNIAYLTLHISYGTFRPVRIEDITQHKIDKEYFSIPESTIKLIRETNFNKKRIFAVGTTTLRALESYSLGIKEGYTDLFIYPGYQFRLVDCLITNFHLPRTTLFMLVCAFAGIELIKKAYQEAIDKRYRFYSYGDAMLII
ncbi:MAG: tRNA preQ1(34) S-adenosylmethionine ribosyltransferase-isomerase QueA [Candidatus Omnitrophica bacterium]|nr:tRNA preQ1(34) S-adenosylmethionine ribosyltransferase-isomerase QueA [Candidatus Omnitrophota bacterium]